MPVSDEEQFLRHLDRSHDDIESKFTAWDEQGPEEQKAIEQARQNHIGESLAKGDRDAQFPGVPDKSGYSEAVSQVLKSFEPLSSEDQFENFLDFYEGVDRIKFYEWHAKGLEEEAKGHQALEQQVVRGDESDLV